MKLTFVTELPISRIDCKDLFVVVSFGNVKRDVISEKHKSLYFVILKVTSLLGGTECQHAKSNTVQRVTGFKVISQILGLKSVPATVCHQLGSNDRLAFLIQAL